MINTIKKVFVSIKNFIFRHKIISLIIVLILLGGGYWEYTSLTNTSGVTRYVLADVTKGTVISSVSGTGQVSASNQIALSPGSGASGKIVYLNAVSGQKVTAGTLLLQLDATDAEKTVRNAEASLQAAKISLQKLQGANSPVVPQNKQNAQNALNQDYQTGYNDISNDFTVLPNIMTNLNTILYGNTFNNFQKNIDYYAYNANSYDTNALLYRNSADKSYKAAETAYEQNFLDYKNISRSSDIATISSMITETYNTTKDISQAVKDANNLIQFYKDTFSKYNLKTTPQADTDINNLNTYSGQIDTNINNLLNVQTSITSDTQSVSNADLDLNSQQLSITDAQNSLQDAKDNLANYYIYAPFDGVIGAVSVQKGQTLSSGTSAITFITQTEMTTISLSETDVPKIKLGEKAIITFDAISGLSIAGQVTEIDTIGTVSQGVVSYNVQVTFDTQDPRIKPGMSTSVNIITDTQQNVLTVPNSAVKTKGGSSYVLALAKKQDLTSQAASQGFTSVTAPTQKIVQIGLADDTNTQITSGLSEGDQVVVRTITNTATATAASSANRSAIPGLTGGAVRVGGGTGGGGNFRPGG